MRQIPRTLLFRSEYNDQMKFLEQLDFSDLAYVYMVICESRSRGEETDIRSLSGTWLGDGWGRLLQRKQNLGQMKSP